MSEEKRMGRLGRGLSALLGDDPPPLPVPATAESESVAGGARLVPIERLHRGRFQPRRHFDPEQIEALTQSIRAQGVLQPLLVRPHPEHPGDYEIVAGERRWRAAQAAQLTEVPVVVRDLDQREALEVALVENVQRQDLNAVEEARGYQRLVAEFGHTQEEIARVTGKSRPHIANTLRLLNLPDDVLTLVEQGKLSAGHARPLVGHADAAAIARRAVAEQMNVRQVEALAKPRTAPAPAANGHAAATPNANPNLRALQSELESLTGMRTEISEKSGAGKLLFVFTDLDQIDALLAKLRR
jgi:ParB family chromosome partitioning protein